MICKQKPKEVIALVKFPAKDAPYQTVAIRKPTRAKSQPAIVLPTSPPAKPKQTTAKPKKPTAKPKPTKTPATSTKKRRGGGGRRRRKPEVTPPSSNTSIDSFFMSHIPPDERPGRHRKDNVTRTTPRRRCSKATASRSTPPRYHNNNDTAAATDAATSSTKRHRNNTNLDESWRPENATLTSSSRSSTPPNDEDSRQLTVDDFPNKLAYDAYCVEQDELLAKKLQEKFNREAQQHRNVQRHKGGKDEYMLREKRQPAAPKYGSIFTF